MDKQPDNYYLPTPSAWPVKGSIALVSLLAGVANWLHNEWYGPYLIVFGLLMLFYVIHGWFGTVIAENRAGLLQKSKVEKSFRLGMCFFIFSEVMFFSAFFGALFYVRVFVLPALGDAESITHVLLWPAFQATWPLLENPSTTIFSGPQSGMTAWGVSTINTAILLTSGITVTIAHFSLLNNRRYLMLWSQLATIILGFSFVIMQAREYTDAYLVKGLTLSSGIYGSTFFMLTGFHGLHVTIGATALSVIFYRMLKRDFNPHNHFGFEAVSWYWHFVDVIWLLLFIFVYWL